MPRTKYDAVARQHLTALELERYYERSGILEHDAGMTPEQADERAYRGIVKWS